MIFEGMITVFSNKIVFPGLETVLGIENIVGKANVVYLDGYAYNFTNPDAMAKWIVGVAVIGLVISGVGVRVCFKGKGKL